MKKMMLIQFAEERIEQFRNDLLQANQEENELSLLLTGLNDKKNEYWNQIMEHLQAVTEPDNRNLAYSAMSVFHSQFQTMLTAFETTVN